MAMSDLPQELRLISRAAGALAEQQALACNAASRSLTPIARLRDFRQTSKAFPVLDEASVAFVTQWPALVATDYLFATGEFLLLMKAAVDPDHQLVHPAAALARAASEHALVAQYLADPSVPDTTRLARTVALHIEKLRLYQRRHAEDLNGHHHGAPGSPRYATAFENFQVNARRISKLRAWRSRANIRPLAFPSMTSRFEDEAFHPLAHDYMHLSFATHGEPLAMRAMFTFTRAGLWAPIVILHVNQLLSAAYYANKAIVAVCALSGKSIPQTHFEAQLGMGALEAEAKRWSDSNVGWTSP